jgi:hypothetical protein
MRTYILLAVIISFLPACCKTSPVEQKPELTYLNLGLSNLKEGTYQIAYGAFADTVVIRRFDETPNQFEFLTATYNITKQLHSDTGRIECSPSRFSYATTAKNPSWSFYDFQVDLPLFLGKKWITNSTSDSSTVTHFHKQYRLFDSTYFNVFEVSRQTYYLGSQPDIQTILIAPKIGIIYFYTEHGTGGFTDTMKLISYVN